MAIPTLDERIVVHVPPGAQHAIERAEIHAHLSPPADSCVSSCVMDCGPTVSNWHGPTAATYVRGDNCSSDLGKPYARPTSVDPSAR